MKQFVILMFALAIAVPAHAQDVTEETSALVEGLYDRVDQLTAQVNELTTAKPQKKESWTDKVKFGGKAYLNYSTLMGGQKKGNDITQYDNGFDVTRVYLTMKAKPTDWSLFRLTTDLGRIKDPKGEDSLGGPLKVSFDNRFFVYVKYAYLELKEPLLNGKFTLGQQELPWIGFVEKAWGYRWIRKVLTDLNHLQTSADLGFSYKGTVGKYVDYHVAVANGPGYKAPENNTFKNPMGRVTLHPVKGLSLSAFGSYDVRTFDAPGKNAWTVAALAAYKQKSWGNVGLEYTRGRDRKHTKLGWGLSGFAMAKPWKESRIVLRYDAFDADTNSKTDNRSLLIAGLGWDFNTHLKTLVNVQAETADSDNSETTAYWNWLAKF